MIMIKQWAEQIQLSYNKNRDMIIDATLQVHRVFSGVVFFLLLFYFILIIMTDYVLWKTWNQQHLYILLISAVVGANWLIHRKPLFSRDQTQGAANCFILILLLSLAAGRAMGSGYVSYTLAVCVSVSTIVLCLNPVHYSLLALTAMLSEIFFNYICLGGDSVTLLYYGVDAFLIFAVSACLNFFFSLLRCQLFEEANTLRIENSTDSLTGLYNRKYFEHYFHFHHREDELSAIIHIDLDNFKTVNDTMGHEKGDQVLVQVAEILRHHFRKSDCVSRVGGDEFMVFMPALSQTQFACERVQSLLDEFPITVDNGGAVKPVQVSLSIGAAFSQASESYSYSQLYQKADHAMYQAKKAGKGKAVFSDMNVGADVVMEGAQR